MSDVREASLELGPERLPGGPIGQVGPFLLLAVGAIWLYASWDRLPPRLPVHWNYRFDPDRFVNRTPSGAATPLLLGLALCALLFAIQLGVVYLAPRTTLRAPSLKIALAGEYFCAFACCGVLGASISAGRMLAPVIALSFAGTVALLVGTWLSARRQPRPPVRNPSAWRGGIFYVDRDDPAVLVPKRSGLGYTFNLGNPLAVAMMLALVAVPLLIGLYAISAR